MFTGSTLAHMESQLCLYRDMRAGSSNNVCLCARVSKKYISIYLQMEKFILGMNFCGTDDEFHRVIGFCCQGCPLVSDNFIQLATATKRVLSNISALLIFLMITVNLDGLVYALSTWKYERETDSACITEGTVWFYGQTH